MIDGKVNSRDGVFRRYRDDDVDSNGVGGCCDSKTTKTVNISLDLF